MTKYGSVKTECEGRLFDSKREAARFQELRILERSGIISGLELQKVFELNVNGVKVCTYRADFVYFNQAGQSVCEDAKGVRTAVYSIKCKLMLAVYGIRIVEV